MGKPEEIYVTGTHYGIGYELGSTTKCGIERLLLSHDCWTNTWLPFIQTQPGRELYDGYLCAVKEGYPQYYQEMLGIAHGSDTPFESIFTLNLRAELPALIHLDKQKRSNKSKSMDEQQTDCTDILLSSRNESVIGHNEDQSSCMDGLGFLAHVTVTSDKASGDSGTEIIEKFTSYALPGLLFGHTFAILPCGIVMTINSMHPETVQANKIPRHVQNRSLLGSSDLMDFERRLLCQDVGIASGCGVNVGVLHTSQEERSEIYVYEVAPLTDHPSSYIEKQLLSCSGEGGSNRNAFFHYNRYELITIPQLFTRTSDARAWRVKQLASPRNISDVRNILGDTANIDDYSIYHKDKRDSSTVITAIFDLRKRTLELFSDNPMSTNEPCTVIHF